MRNVLDGRVSMVHPDVRGYDSQDAWDEMCSWLGDLYGKEWMSKVRFNTRDGFMENIREVGA